MTSTSHPSPEARVAVLAGATGLVGTEILARLRGDERYRLIHTIGRRAPARQDARLQHHTVDWAQLPALGPVDEVYIALGTTIKVAGSQAAFRAVDFDAVLAVAEAGLAWGAQSLGVVSAMGAHPGSTIFYSRTKGEMEEAVAHLGYRHLTFARPSLLAGNRATLGQPVRRGEEIGMTVSRLLRPLIPANYRSIAAADVAAALVRQVQADAPGVHVLLSGAMQAH